MSCLQCPLFSENHQIDKETENVIHSQWKSKKSTHKNETEEDQTLDLADKTFFLKKGILNMFNDIRVNILQES